MSKIISGTESYPKGAMYVPDGSDDGNEFSSVIVSALTRLALHDHSSDGAPAALPRSTEIVFNTPSLVADTSDDRFYMCELMLSLVGPPAVSIPMTKKNIAIYYRLNSTTDVPSAWVKISPKYVVDDVDDKKITLYGLPRNDIKLKVIG